MRSTTRLGVVAVAVASSGLAIAACKSSLSPDDGAAQVESISITSTGVVPSTVYVSPGGRVRFTNNSSTNRQINSDPFPAHSGCPPINEVALLTPGQTKETGVLTFAGACGFHDHLTEGTQPQFSGTILVGTTDPGSKPPDGY